MARHANREDNGKNPSPTAELQQNLLNPARETWFPEETATIKDIDHHAGRLILAMGKVKSVLEPLIS
jgi:hypothetical protein